MTYLEQIMSARPLLRIDLERKVQKVPESRRQILLLPEAGRAVRRNEPKRLQRRLVEVRRLAFHHFDRHDA